MPLALGNARSRKIVKKFDRRRNFPTCWPNVSRPTPTLPPDRCRVGRDRKATGHRSPN